MSGRIAAACFVAALLSMPARAQQHLGPPAVPPAQLRSYASALLDTADYLERASADGVRCDGSVAWKTRGSVPIRTKMAETLEPWKAGDSAWNYDLDWVITARRLVQAPGRSCDGDLGMRPTWWSAYCTICPTPYDATIKMMRDDARSLQKMADVVACLEGSVASREDKLRRDEEAAALKKREEQRDTRPGGRTWDDSQRAAGRTPVEQQRTGDQVGREREGSPRGGEARDVERAQEEARAARLSARQRREQESVESYGQFVAGATELSRTQVEKGAPSGEVWFTGDMAYLKAQTESVQGFGVTVGLRQAFWSRCGGLYKRDSCTGLEFRAQFHLASGSRDTGSGEPIDISRRRFELEAAYMFDWIGLAGHWEKGSTQDVSVSRFGPGLVLSLIHTKEGMIESSAFFLPRGGGLLRVTLGMNMLSMGVEYAWSPVSGGRPAESIVKIPFGVRLPW